MTLEYNIKLKQLTLKNFRCFDVLEIDFNERVTVFIAENGGGKTAILDVIAEGLKAYLNALKIRNQEKSELNENDVLYGTNKSENSLFVDVTYPFPISALEKGVILNIDEWDSNSEKVRFDVDLSAEGGKLSTEISSSFARDARYFREKYQESNLPALVYYGGRSVDIH